MSRAQIRAAKHVLEVMFVKQYCLLNRVKIDAELILRKVLIS